MIAVYRNKKKEEMFTISWKYNWKPQINLGLQDSSFRSRLSAIAIAQIFLTSFNVKK